MMNVRKKGFTLIEVMIVLAIVAIVAAIAVPAFLDAVRQSRRSDAINAIMDLQLAEERHRANNRIYAINSQLGLPSPIVSSGGHYNVNVFVPILASAKLTTYTITAAPINGQVNDSCGMFTLVNTAGVIVKTTSRGDADQCWRK